MCYPKCFRPCSKTERNHNLTQSKGAFPLVSCRRNFQENTDMSQRVREERNVSET